MLTSRALSSGFISAGGDDISLDAWRSALGAITPLVRANMEHIIEHGPAGALTGPIERNDATTVASHLQCFDAPEERELYRYASLKLVEVAQKKHPEADYATMRETLKA